MDIRKTLVFAASGSSGNSKGVTPSKGVDESEVGANLRFSTLIELPNLWSGVRYKTKVDIIQ